MSLIAGSYERFIWGFNLKTLKDKNTLTLSPLFSYPSHLSSIKSVAAAGAVAASSSSDDSVKIYDLSTASEIGSLTDHSVTVNSLAFYTPKSLSLPRNLISAAADGTVCIYDANPFVLLKTLRVHKKGISDLAVHESGKLAMTVGRDSCLGMVNLVRGRRSFYCKLDKEASLIRFGVGGDKFYLGMDDNVSVHDSEDAKLLFELECKNRILCMCAGENGILFTGGEDKCITAWDTNSGKLAYSIEDAHSARIKGIVVLSRSGGAGSAEDDPYLVASASNDGVIRVWDVRMAVKEKPTPLAEAKTNSRLTCLAGSSLKSFKRSRVGKTAPKESQDAEMDDL